MIQGIMKCGMGNWADIADQYVRLKSSTECEEHYFSVIYQATDINDPSKVLTMKYDTILASNRQDFKEVIIEPQDDNSNHTSKADHPAQS